MAKKKKETKPTDAELAILSVLWKLGPSTVRDTHGVLSSDKSTGYTTTLKLMQIMAEKGLLKRDDSGFRHVYSPAVGEEHTQNQIVGNLVDQAFAGSAGKLVMRALSAKKVPPEELARIRKMIDTMEKEAS